MNLTDVINRNKLSIAKGLGEAAIVVLEYMIRNADPQHACIVNYNTWTENNISPRTARSTITYLKNKGVIKSEYGNFNKRNAIKLWFDPDTLLEVLQTEFPSKSGRKTKPQSIQLSHGTVAVYERVVDASILSKDTGGAFTTTATQSTTPVPPFAFGVWSELSIPQTHTAAPAPSTTAPTANNLDLSPVQTNECDRSFEVSSDECDRSFEVSPDERVTYRQFVRDLTDSFVMSQPEFSQMTDDEFEKTLMHLYGEIQSSLLESRARARCLFNNTSTKAFSTYTLNPYDSTVPNKVLSTKKPKPLIVAGIRFERASNPTVLSGTSDASTARASAREGVLEIIIADPDRREIEPREVNATSVPVGLFDTLDFPDDDNAPVRKKRRASAKALARQTLVGMIGTIFFDCPSDAEGVVALGGYRARCAKIAKQLLAEESAVLSMTDYASDPVTTVNTLCEELRSFAQWWRLDKPAILLPLHGDKIIKHLLAYRRERAKSAQHAQRFLNRFRD